MSRAAVARAVAVLLLAVVAHAEVQGTGGSADMSAELRRERSEPRPGIDPKQGGRIVPPVSNSCTDCRVKPPSANRIPQAPAASFTDTFLSLNQNFWAMAGVWANGGIFNNIFSPLEYAIVQSAIRLRLTRRNEKNPTTAGSGVPGKIYPFVGAEARTKTVNYGGGCYSACIRPTRTSGVVTSFYVYSNGLWDSEFQSENITVPHREIDIEFLVRNGAVVMQSNVFNDPPVNHPNKGWEQIHKLPFDASTTYACYGFKWTSTAIQWYVNGVMVREMRHSTATKIPLPSQQKMRFLMNTYSVTPENGGLQWAGAVPPAFKFDDAFFKWVRHDNRASCNVIRSCSAIA